jgi:hypothetical protein
MSPRRTRTASRLALPALLGAALLAGCAKEPAPFGRHAAFVPVVLDSRIPGRVPWETRVDVTNDGPASGVVRVTRWPPDRREAEVEDYVVPAGSTRGIPSRVPLFPSVSSFWLESETPFHVRAAVTNRKGPLPPPLEVPVLSPDDLARPGDTLRLGPFLSDDETRSHFCYTFPGTDLRSVPYRVRTVFTGLDGSLLGRFESGLAGVPTLIEDPWLRFALPERRPFLLEVTFLGSARGRAPRHGLWVYGIVTDRRTNASRFLPTTVVRAR